MRTEAWAAAAGRAILAGNFLWPRIASSLRSVRDVASIETQCEIRPIRGPKLDGDLDHRSGVHICRLQARSEQSETGCFGPAAPISRPSACGRVVAGVDICF